MRACLSRKSSKSATTRRARSILEPVSASAAPAPLAYVPNALTVFRLALIPVFVVVLASADGGYSWPAAILFAVAGVTDQLDGWLARRWRVESAFGRVADPLADRLMIDAAVILLVLVHDRLPWPALALVLARDALAHRRVQADRAPRLRALGQLPREGRHLGALCVARLRHGHARGHPVAALALLDGARRSRSPRACSTWSRLDRRCDDEGRRHGGRRGHAPAAADLEPAEADGADRRQAVHGAHRRACCARTVSRT